MSKSCVVSIGTHTGLRIEVLGIADLHWARCAVNSRVVVDGVFPSNVSGIHRCVCLALCLVSVISEILQS